MKKKLLIVFNCYGQGLKIRKQVDTYIKNIESLFWHIDYHNLQNDVRIIVSANNVPDYVLCAIKRKFGNRLTIFFFDVRRNLQLTYNRSCLFAEQYFDEKYEGYCYMSSGVCLPKKEDLFSRLINKLSTGDYGVIALQSNYDGLYQYLGYLYDYKKHIDFTQDYLIPPGCFTAGHFHVIHESIRNFFDRPWSDVFGHGNGESSYFFMASSLRKKYILMGDSEHQEEGALDSMNRPYSLLQKQKDPWPNHWYIGLLHGRTFEDTFFADQEGIEAGLGFHCDRTRYLMVEHNVTPVKYLINPREDKYDENYLSIDERLKYAVKRNYFTTKDEVDYDKIKVHVL